MADRVADRVAEAMSQVRRAQFLTPDQRGRALHDGPLPIGHGQTNSQPRTVAAMLELLEVRPGLRVLDVGSGSGWTTALLGHLVGPGGSVLGVDLEPDLVAASRVALRDSAVAGRVRVERALNGELGCPAGAPWDRILVSAMAEELPRPLLDQLADPGILVVPVAGEMLRVVRHGAEETITRHGRYRFVPLR